MTISRIAMMGIASVAAKVCTSENKDPYATGVKVSCCNDLKMELKNWNDDGRWFYKCTKSPSPTPTPTPSETIVLMSEEVGLCLEPAGDLEGVCSFHDVGLDFKQSLRFAECDWRSLDQQWIVEHRKSGVVNIKSAKNEQYCMTVPGPYYGSVIDPKNHGDFEVWLCQCDQTTVLDAEAEKNLSWNGTVLEYDNDSDGYLVGVAGYDKPKMSLCFDAGGDPNPDAPKCEGLHWRSTGNDRAGDVATGSNGLVI